MLHTLIRYKYRPWMYISTGLITQQLILRIRVLHCRGRVYWDVGTDMTVLSDDWRFNLLLRSRFVQLVDMKILDTGLQEPPLIELVQRVSPIIGSFYASAAVSAHTNSIWSRIASLAQLFHFDLVRVGVDNHLSKINTSEEVTVTPEAHKVEETNNSPESINNLRTYYELVIIELLLHTSISPFFPLSLRYPRTLANSETRKGSNFLILIYFEI